MDPRLHEILSRLPKNMIACLKENRGDESSIWFLLEMCRENNYINAEEEKLLYNALVKKAEPNPVSQVPPAGYNNQSMPMGYGNQVPPAGYNNQTMPMGYPNQAPYGQQVYNPNSLYGQQMQTNAHAIEANLENRKKGKKLFRTGVVVAVILLLCALFMCIEPILIENPEKLTDNLSSINAGTDYLIEEAIVVGDYAEFYEVPENIKDPDNASDDVKTVKDEFYIIAFRDNNDNAYIASLSVKPDSEISEELKNFDFENELFYLTAYCTAKDLSTYESDFEDDDLSAIYKESCDDISLYLGEMFEFVEMNFEYQHPEDYDYVESAKEGAIFAGGFYLIAGIGFIVMAVKGKKKQKTAAAELEKLGYSE